MANWSNQQGFPLLATRIEQFESKLKSRPSWWKKLFWRNSSRELESMIDDFEALIHLFGEVTQRTKLRRLDIQIQENSKSLTEIHQSVIDLEAIIVAISGGADPISKEHGSGSGSVHKQESVKETEYGLHGAFEDNFSPHSLLLQLQAAQSSVHEQEPVKGSETEAPVPESSVPSDRKKGPVFFAKPVLIPISIVTGEDTSDLAVEASFDLNSQDDWIRRDLIKELRLQIEPMKTEETNIGPGAKPLAPQGRASLTWSSYSPDSKSKSTFLVHTDLPSRVVFGSALLSETMASSSPAAFAFWRSKLTAAQTEELRKQHGQRNASLTKEQQVVHYRLIPETYNPLSLHEILLGGRLSSRRGLSLQDS
ncbi:hypothetical protein PG996_003884 [Apiospora saccharicola]|uniref:Uncharacterized protein n=1 Tax=Apiospora saccharicola TaxID=335842 RepID=A0ABR1W2K4_9PEZI